MNETMTGNQAAELSGVHAPHSSSVSSMGSSSPRRARLAAVMGASSSGSRGSCAITGCNDGCAWAHLQGNTQSNRCQSPKLLLCTFPVGISATVARLMRALSSEGLPICSTTVRVSGFAKELARTCRGRRPRL